MKNKKYMNKLRNLIKSILITLSENRRNSIKLKVLYFLGGILKLFFKNYARKLIKKMFKNSLEYISKEFLKLFLEYDIIVEFIEEMLRVAL